MTIWISGARGMLGQELMAAVTAAGLTVVGTDADVDITDPERVTAFMSAHRPTWILNAAAYTAVDRAESDEEKAMRVNGQGPGILAAAAARGGATLVHLSTDYVFSGEKAGLYDESDKPAPASAYGRTKLAGECAIQASADRFFILRISWLYGVFGPNFVRTMLRLMAERPEVRVVADQHGAPTCARTLAANIVRMIVDDAASYGIYHCSDLGETTWFGLAAKARELALQHGLLTKAAPIIPITTEEYPCPAPRPKNSRFCTDRARHALGFALRPWEENLERFVRTLAREASRSAGPGSPEAAL